MFGGWILVCNRRLGCNFFMFWKSYEVQSCLWNLRDITAAEIRDQTFYISDSFQHLCSSCFSCCPLLPSGIHKTGQDELASCQTSERNWAEDIRGCHINGEGQQVGHLCLKIIPSRQLGLLGIRHTMIWLEFQTCWHSDRKRENSLWMSYGGIHHHCQKCPNVLMLSVCLVWT